MTVLVTGGAGFIGANFVLDWLAQDDELVINLDKLTYAGNLENLKSVEGATNYFFEKADIQDVDADPVLEARYDELVPVLAARAGSGMEKELCHYHLNPDAVRAYLAEIR